MVVVGGWARLCGACAWVCVSVQVPMTHTGGRQKARELGLGPPGQQASRSGWLRRSATKRKSVLLSPSWRSPPEGSRARSRWQEGCSAWRKVGYQTKPRSFLLEYEGLPESTVSGLQGLDRDELFARCRGRTRNRCTTVGPRHRQTKNN